MVDVSVVVVSWNARRYVQECLESIRHTVGVTVQVIVVDNGSSDGTPEMVIQDFPHVFLIPNSQNLGFARANNIGIQAATGKYVCLVNSDVNVPPECLSHLYRYLEHNPTVGMVGPRMLIPNGNVARSYMRFPTSWNCLCHALSLDVLFRGSRLFGGILMTDFRCETTSEVDVLNGWFVAVRRNALREVGLLDEAFFMYGEDIDWSYRFHKSGWKRIYLTSAQALHYGGASSSVAPTRFYIEMHKANLQYWRKHHTSVEVLGYWLITLIHHMLRVVGHGVVYLTGRDRQATACFKVRRSAACIAWMIGLRAH